MYVRASGNRVLIEDSVAIVTKRRIGVVRGAEVARYSSDAARASTGPDGLASPGIEEVTMSLEVIASIV